MKTVGVIPARFGSSRFPGKPLARIAGLTLIERVYRQAALARLDRVIVATDDSRIMDAVASFGGEAVMTGEHPSGTDRIAEAVRGTDADIIVNIQGDEPLIDPRVIGTVAAALSDSAWAVMSTAVTRLESAGDIDNPNIVKCVFASDGRALYFSRSRIPYNRNESGHYHKHLGIYGYRKDFLERYIRLPKSQLESAESLEQLRVLEHGYAIHVSVVEYDSVGVDVPEDVERVERLLRERD